jgi:hypothetical protein
LKLVTKGGEVPVPEPERWTPSFRSRFLARPATPLVHGEIAETGRWFGAEQIARGLLMQLDADNRIRRAAAILGLRPGCRRAQP